MKKALILVAIAALIILGVALIGHKPPKLSTGRATPQLAINDNGSSVDLKDLKGKYVLLDFWRSADAPSRIQTNQYNTVDVNGIDDLERVSVNLDPSRDLFNEVVARDHMDPEQQFHASGSQADKIIKDFDLKDDIKSYLIDPSGQIVAVNPDTDYLNHLFGTHA